MTPRTTRWGVIVALAGLLMLTLQAELRSRSGKAWLLPIKGYDPRDIVHGHYLRYRFELDWAEEGRHSCGAEGRHLDPNCCVCLESTVSGVPIAVRVPCETRPRCDSWIRGSELEPPLRYLVPEAEASALERALRQHDAELEVRTLPDGTLSIGELLLDGRPWNEGLAPER